MFIQNDFYRLVTICLKNRLPCNNPLWAYHYCIIFVKLERGEKRNKTQKKKKRTTCINSTLEIIIRQTNIIQNHS